MDIHAYIHGYTCIYIHGYTCIWLLKLLTVLFSVQTFDLFHKNRFQRNNCYKNREKHMIKPRNQHTF